MITSSPALSHTTASRGLVVSGAEYSGWAWSTYSRAPLVRITFARPVSSSVSWPGTEMPNSVSVPMIRRTLMELSLRGTGGESGCCVHRVTCQTARMDQLVAILDDRNQVVGAAPRSVMRRDNLRHSATGVVVRN